MKRLLFIYNPYAGKGLLKNSLAEVIDLFVKAGYDVVAYPTQAYRDGYRKILEMDAKDYDLIVCSGGDGTLDEVVTGMMQREDRLPVGYIPAGSTNDFARSLHIPTNLMRAADTAVNGKLFPCDVGSFNDGTFVYIAAFGLFTDVSYETDQNLKNILGHVAYFLEGSKRIFNIPSYKMKVTHDDEVIEEEFVYGMVTNSKSVGGFKNMVGKNVLFDDGVFEVTLIKMPKNPIELQEILAALMLEEVDTKYIHTFKTSEVLFESEEEIPWTLDGEYGGSHEEVVVKNNHCAMEIMIPEKQYEKFRKKQEKLIAEAEEAAEEVLQEAPQIEEMPEEDFPLSETEILPEEDFPLSETEILPEEDFPLSEIEILPEDGNA